MKRSEDKRLRWVRVLTILFTFHLSLITSSAQEDPEYRLEIGGGIGTVTYLGDYNDNLLKGMQPWGTVMAKYKINPRMAVGMTLGYGRIKGTSNRVTTWYPQEYYEFGTKMVDGGFRFEYNFWPYGTGREYRGAKPLTPFFSIGLGATYAKADKSVFTANLPIGIGVKYKLADRINLGLEWSIHFSMSDHLDGKPDPYSIKSSGMFKNTDCYSALQATISYSFMAKCRTCHNEDE